MRERASKTQRRMHMMGLRVSWKPSGRKHASMPKEKGYYHHRIFYGLGRTSSWRGGGEINIHIMKIKENDSNSQSRSGGGSSSSTSSRASSTKIVENSKTK